MIDLLITLATAMVLGVIYGSLNRAISIRKLKSKSNDFLWACWILTVLIVIGATVAIWNSSVPMAITFFSVAYLSGFIPNAVSIYKYDRAQKEKHSLDR